MNLDLELQLDIAFHVSAVVADPTPEALAAVLPRLREAGYRRAVLPPLDPAATDAAALRRAFEEADIAPIAMTGQAPGADVSSADEAERREGAAALRAAVDFAAALGADQLNGVPYGLFGPPGAPTPRDALERAAREVGAVADEASDRGITMTFEVLNRYETSAINTAAQALEFVELSGSRSLGIHLDTYHMAIEEADMAAAIRDALPRLAYLELGQSGRGLLSTGVVDIPKVVQQTLDEGYTGRWGVEAFSRPLVGDGAGDMLAIWRAPYDDGVELAADAVRVIRRGWAESAAGRRAQRLARSGA
ncbi:sugar phosphate isomerase/epimerase family protein [Microbacterium sp.]|uniref:sugar phosphate isomerase/epimerase family protein n=1 Tax=Microbacterium sp. TaxID=51671 RepID=UPI002B643282|nr:sugar phosphate isomerase/epimerase family protein [Microbacterium sp.]HWL76158.1 sugar phosphate isomerase/epimerase family protein [Microbacterium sp.]